MKRARSSFPLILEPLEAKAVARRAKTQLRRLATVARMAGGESVTRACGLRAANTYEVSRSDTGDVLARVVVTSVALQQLGDVDSDAALAEGHSTVVGFADAWLRRHDRGWPPQEEKLCSNCAGHTEFTDHGGAVVPCTVCELGVVMGDRPTPIPEVLERFASHADRRVWVVNFMLDDRRFLHRHSQRGYTSNPADALQGEPEAVGPREIERMAKDGRRRRAQQQHAEIETAGIDELRRLAAEQNVSLRDFHKAEERRIRKAQEREADWLAKQLRDRVDRAA